MVNRDEIRRRREVMGLTLEEAAQRAGFYGRQRWYQIEHGERDRLSAETLWAVAKVLGCRMDDLMADDKPARPRGREG